MVGDMDCCAAALNGAIKRAAANYSPILDNVIGILLKNKILKTQ